MEEFLRKPKEASLDEYLKKFVEDPLTKILKKIMRKLEEVGYFPKGIPGGISKGILKAISESNSERFSAISNKKSELYSSKLRIF